jgi:hypothetical protein
MHDNGVAHFGADQRPQDSKVLTFTRALLLNIESAVPVFAIHGFSIHLAYTILGLLDPDF